MQNDLLITGQFLANTIHEIRTPIQTIIGMLELLEQTNLDKEQSEYLRQMQFSADVLLSLANDILDFSKIQSGKFKIEKIPMNVINVAEQTVDLICIEAHLRGLEIVTDIDYGIEPIIKSDPTRIQQILLNLLKNAVKFTHSGYVRIRLSKCKDGERLLFAVQDSGIGVPAEKQKKLFRDFYQVNASTTRQYGGTGLGLSICKGLVDAMGGKIGMKTNPKGGSVFWFTIPFENVKNEENKKAAPLIPQDTSILLVDDSPLSLRSLYDKLHILTDCRIDAVSSGAQALQQMKKAAQKGNPYTIAFIDMLMPKMDGWRLAAQINNDKDINGTKLYLMVPEGQMGGEAKMKMLDWFNGYLYKPIKFRILKEILVQHFDTPLDLEVIETDEPEAQEQMFCAAGLTILAVEDHPVNQKLIQTFLTQFGAQVLTADNGEQAVQCIQEHPATDLIFMDIQMPVKNGMEATAQLRSLGYTGVIIACTANTDASDFNLYLNNGMDDILTKPFKRKNIQDMLKKWEKRLRSGRTAQDNRDAVTQTVQDKMHDAATADFWNRDDFNDTVGNDRDLAHQLIRQYCEQTLSLIQKAHTSIQNKDFPELVHASHTLKGSSAALSLNEAAQTAKRMEEAAKQNDGKKAAEELHLFEALFERFKTECER